MNAADEHSARLGEAEGSRPGIEGKDARPEPGLEDLEPAHVVERHVGVDQLEARVAPQRSALLGDHPRQTVFGVREGAGDAEGPTSFVEGQAERRADERVPARGVRRAAVGVEERRQRLGIRQWERDDTRVPIELGRQVRDRHHEHERDVALGRGEIAKRANDPRLRQPGMQIEHDARDACLAGPSRALDACQGFTGGRVVGPSAGGRPFEDARAPEGVADEGARPPLLVGHDAHDGHPRGGGGAKVADEGVAHRRQYTGPAPETSRRSSDAAARVMTRSSRAGLRRSSSRPSRAS